MRCPFTPFWRAEPLFKLVLIFTIVFAPVLSAPLRAESSDSQDLYEQQAKNLEEQRKVQQEIQEGRIKAQQAMEDANRRDKGNGAAAAAAAGAAVAFASCAMLFKQAKELEQTDPAKAAELKAKALEQCGQGAKNLANMGQNQEGASQLTDLPSLPELPEIEFPEAEIPEVAQTPTVAPRNLASAPEPQTALDFGEQLESEPQTSDEFDSALNSTQNPIAQGSAENQTSIPDSLTENFALNDFNSEFGSIGAPNSGGITAGGTNLFGNSNERLQDAVSSSESRSQALRETRTLASGSSSGSSTSSFDSSSSSKGYGMDTKSNFGGGGAIDLGTRAQVNVLAKNEKTGKPKLNIFEYANFRYKKAAYTDARVKVRLPSQIALKRTALLK